MKSVARMLLGLSTAVTFGSVAHATAYTDEAAWRAAVGGVYALQNWDNIAAGTDVTNDNGLGLHFESLNDGTQPTVQRYAQTGGVVKSGPNNLLNDRDFDLPARGPIFVDPLTAGQFLYGLGMWNVGGDDQLRLTFFDAAGAEIESVISSPSFGFFGIVNSSGAVRAEVDFVGGNGYAPTDDWQTAARQTFQPGGVPEPTTWAMLLVGFGAVGATLRSARRRVTTA